MSFDSLHEEHEKHVFVHILERYGHLLIKDVEAIGLGVLVTFSGIGEVPEPPGGGSEQIVEPSKGQHTQHTELPAVPGQQFVEAGPRDHALTNRGSTRPDRKLPYERFPLSSKMGDPIIHIRVTDPFNHSPVDDPEVPNNGSMVRDLLKELTPELGISVTKQDEHLLIDDSFLDQITDAIKAINLKVPIPDLRSVRSADTATADQKDSTLTDSQIESLVKNIIKSPVIIALGEGFCEILIMTIKEHVAKNVYQFLKRVLSMKAGRKIEIIYGDNHVFANTEEEVQKVADLAIGYLEGEKKTR